MSVKSQKIIHRIIITLCVAVVILNYSFAMAGFSDEGEGQQIQERNKPYNAIVNSVASNDRKAIASIYLTRPYEYECDIETIDKEIGKFDNFIKKYPDSAFVIEALTNIAWLELYTLQCGISNKDQVVRLEKAKACYKKIFTNHNDKDWGKTAKELYDILLTDKNRMKGIEYSKISDLCKVIEKQIPLCANPSEITKKTNQNSIVEGNTGAQYFPIKVGSRWVYDGAGRDITTVDSEVMINGKNYYKIITVHTPGESAAPPSYKRVDKNGVYILFDSSQPDKGEILLRTFPFTAGVSGSFTNRSNAEVKWRVEPGGTVSINNKQYDNCLKITTNVNNPKDDLFYTSIEYLAPNVGLVKVKTIPKKLHQGEVMPSERILVEYTP